MKIYCLGLLMLLAMTTAMAQDDTLGYRIVREGGRLVSSYHPIYDQHDRLAVEVRYYYDSNGVVERRVLQSLDKHGYKLRKEEYTADDELLFVEQYRWCRHVVGKLRQVRMFRTISYETDGSTIKSTYRYFRLRKGNTITFLNGRRMKISREE